MLFIASGELPRRLDINGVSYYFPSEHWKWEYPDGIRKDPIMWTDIVDWLDTRLLLTDVEMFLINTMISMQEQFESELHAAR
jgi:hypothetical protein